jgi:hypothetical protein
VVARKPQADQSSGSLTSSNTFVGRGVDLVWAVRSSLPACHDGVSDKFRDKQARRVEVRRRKPGGQYGAGVATGPERRTGQRSEIKPVA